MEGKGTVILSVLIIALAIGGGMYYVSFTLDNTVRELYQLKDDAQPEKEKDEITINFPTVQVPEWATDHANKLQINGAWTTIQ